MKPIFNTLIGLLLLLSSAVINAQVLDIKFTPAMPGGTVGSVITVDVVANKFEGIAGMTFPILYDKTKLQFKTITSLTPDLPGFIYNQATGTPPLCPGGGLPPCSSSIDNPIAGKIALLWFDPAGTGNYLDPNTVLFKIQFTVLAAGTSNIFVSSTTTPTLSVIGMGNVPATFTYPVGVTPPPPIVGFALIVPQDSVRPGETVCVPVTVNDFNNILTMQFMVNWNSNVFTFSHIQNYGIAGLSCGAFNTNVPGRAAVQWEDVSAVGVTLPNGASIFDVCLIANGPNATNGTISSVACNGVGMPITSPVEVVNTANQDVWSTATSSIPGNILVSSTAQFEDEIVRYKADTVNVAQVGDSASVAIKVRKFKNINQFQFVVSYDVAVLGTGVPRLITTLPNTVTGNGAFLVELITGQPGKLKVSWRAGSATNGQTLADDATLCILKFPTSSATPGAMTNVTIGSLETVVPPIPLQTQEKPNAYMAPPNARVPSCPYKPRTDNGWVKMGTVSAVPSVTLVGKTDVNCFGVNIGAIDISVSGGLTTTYTYKWSNTPMSTTQDLTGVGAGTYTVTVTAGTASTTFSATIAGPASAISVPSNTVTLTNVKCFGGTDGAISIAPTGGTAPYTYNWGNGVTTQNRTALGGGSYTVTITDSKGCTFVPAGYPVTAPSVAMSVATSNIKNIRCLNDLNGGVTLTPAGTQGSVTYAWKNASGSAIAASPASAPTNLAAGTYSVTLTDGNNCTTSTANIVIAAPLSAFSVDPAIVTAPTCAGQNNGTITVNSFGGWAGAATIQWSPLPGTGGFPATGVAPGTYNATVTDAGGCAKAISASVGPGVDNNITNTTATNVTCFSQANGSIAITLSAPFTSVNWTMNGAAAGSGTTISNLGPGTYIPTVSFGTSCTKAFPAVTITEPAALVVSLVSMTQQGQTNDGALDINATGGNTGVITYSWAGPSGFTANTQDISSLAAGDYTVTVKDVKGCQTVQTYTVTKACLICDASAVNIVNSCVTDGCYSVQIPPSASGPFILSWKSSTNPVAQTKTSSDYLIETCNLPSGIYMVTVTDATNTSFELPTFSLAQRPPVAVTSTVANSNLDNKNGSISLTSGPGLALSYDWSMSPTPVKSPPNSLTSPVIFQLDSGTYCVKIKNLLPEGCEETRCFDVIRLYPDLAPCGTVTPLQPNCLTSNNGAIEVFPQGGDNVFTYAWSSGQTTKKISNLGGGTYTVTVTSGDGQTGTCGPYTLAPQSTLAISNVNEISDFNGFQVSGVGVCNGSASVVVTGTTTAVSYLWSNGATGENNTTLCGGTYTVVATDQTGCTSTWSGTLTTPTEVSTAHTLLTDFNDYAVSCNGVCDGIARVTVAGGVPPYIVKWPSGQIDVVNTSGGASIDNDLCAGNTEVEVTDANGIKVAYTLELTEPEPIAITFTDTKPLSLANCNAEIIPEVTGAVGAITYEWFSQYHQGTTQRADGLCADEEVTFIVTDDNGCTETAKHNAPFPTDICFNANPILTPNGDGNNDFFDIKCIHTVPNTLEIYDRWNQAVVKPIVNYQNNWDGKRNGVLVPEGVYFFVATYTDDQGNERTIKGHFNILY
jgi:gliding motility-associated-like protein